MTVNDFDGSSFDISTFYSSEGEYDYGIDYTGHEPENTIMPDLDGHIIRSHSFNIDECLSDGFSMGASDVHLIPGRNVGYTVLGDITFTDKWGVMVPAVITETYNIITTNMNRATFSENYELDTSYVIRSGKHAGYRTRLNVTRSLNEFCLVFRLIKNEIPTPESIGVPRIMQEWVRSKDGSVILAGTTGSGKDLHNSTPIPTPEGLKYLRDIQEGDKVYDDKGEECTVVRKHRGGSERFFIIRFSNGQMTLAGGNHLWVVNDTAKDATRQGPSNTNITLTHDDIKTLTALMVNTLESDRVKLESFLNLLSEPSRDDVRTVIESVFKPVKRRTPQALTVKEIRELIKKEGDIGVQLILDDDEIIVETDTIPTKVEKFFYNERAVPTYSCRKIARYLMEDCWQKMNGACEPNIAGNIMLTTQQLFDAGALKENGSRRWTLYSHNGVKPSSPVEPFLDPAFLALFILDNKLNYNTLTEQEKTFIEAYRHAVEHRSVPKTYDSEIVEIMREAFASEDSTIMGAIFSRAHTWSTQNKIHFLSTIINTIGGRARHGGFYIGSDYYETLEGCASLARSLGWNVSKVKQNSEDNLYITVKAPYTLIDNWKYDKDYRQNMFYFTEYKIIHIDSIEEVIDDPEDYYCLEVDSESHIFLHGEMYIPTHNTTTFASLIRDIQLKYPKNIVTLEKPIEFVYPKDGKSLITQREIGADSRSFVNSMDSCLRVNPNMILLGECRNSDEMNGFRQASESGHFTMTTMHTKKPSVTLSRVRSMYQGGERIEVLNSLKDTLQGLVNQVLVKTPDGQSRTSVYSILPNVGEVSKMIGEGDVEGIDEYMMRTQTTLEHELLKALIEGRTTTLECVMNATDRLFMKHLLEQNGFTVPDII